MFNPKRVAIIGGYGLMGQWFSRFFSRKGCKVVISGRSRLKSFRAARNLGVAAAKSNSDAIKGADLIIVSVMAQRLDGVLKEISPHLEAGQKVIDITSVKSVPVKLLHMHIKKNVALGTHPMFGPSAQAEGQNFILTPTSGKERAFASELRAYLRKSKFNVVIMSPQKHDKMIGAMLSLTHYVGFVTGDTWRSLKIHKFMSTSSTSFRFLESFVKSIVDASPELYSYLQVGVPNVHKVENEFARISREWAELTRRKDRKRLKSRMYRIERYLSRL